MNTALLNIYIFGMVLAIAIILIVLLAKKPK